MNLSYSYRAAWDAGISEHAQIVMRQLGIKYKKSVGQSLGDCFWFFDCENVPQELPKYVSVIETEAQT